MTISSEDTRKPWLEANLKEIMNLIIIEILMVDEPEKREPVTTCMDVYNSNIQSDEVLIN